MNDKLLHPTARQGVLNLIPKQNKDTRLLKNLRPITLLNVDYKILEKILAMRIKVVINDLIHADQKGFLKDRSISANIRKIAHAEEHQLEADILSLDFHKAFDVISFTCLQGALHFFNFGTNFRQWTATLYNEFTVKVQNNGFFSETIDIRRGIHQGGCCSSFYFLLCAELLAILIRGNNNIKGITVEEITYLLGLFADDTDSYINHDQGTITELFHTIEQFGNISGLRNEL